MPKIRRSLVLLATAGLVTGGLAAVASGSPAASADSIFAERWCGPGVVRPCVLSASHNGTPITPGGPIEVQMIPKQVGEAQIYTEVLLQDPSGVEELQASDTFSVYLDLGTIRPDTTESYAFQPDVDRFSDGDGTYKLRFTGKPVLLTTGCTDTYPNHCQDTATGQAMVFDVTINKELVNRDLVGFDRAQSADTVDGIYLIETPIGDFLESHWDNSRYLTDGTSKASASARFRLPYRMLIDSFKIPAPETMISASVVGTVNGVPRPFVFSQDPDGGGVYVDITGVTFPAGEGARAALGSAASKPRVIRVKRGLITPMRPIVQRATRTTPQRARLTFLRAKARGAYVTGYEARCQAPGKPTRVAAGKFPTVVVTGLRAGTKYQCSVRAKSRVGYGAWSLRKQV